MPMNMRISTQRFALAVGLAAFAACAGDEAPAHQDTMICPPEMAHVARQDICSQVCNDDSADPEPDVQAPPEPTPCPRAELEQAQAEAAAANERAAIAEASAEQAAQKTRTAWRRVKFQARAAAQANEMKERLAEELQQARAMLAELERQNADMRASLADGRQQIAVLLTRLARIRSGELQ